MEEFKEKQASQAGGENQADLQSELTNVKKDIKDLDNKLNQILTLLKSSSKETTVNGSTVKAAKTTKEAGLNGSAAKTQPSN